MVTAIQHDDDEITQEDINRVSALISEVTSPNSHQAFHDSFKKWDEVVHKLYWLAEKAAIRPRDEVQCLQLAGDAYTLLAMSTELRVQFERLTLTDQIALTSSHITPRTIQVTCFILHDVARMLEPKTPEELAEIEALKERIFGGAS